ncbi:MAG: DUF4129 domain-containing protein, partial [Candidatus Binatota bacterium]
MGWAIVLGCLAIGWNWLRKIKGRGEIRAQGLTYQATERYRRLLALLRKRRLIKEAGETADEFSRRAESVGISLVKEFTSLYQQARFSGHGELTDGLKKMDQILMQLRK